MIPCPSNSSQQSSIDLNIVLLPLQCIAALSALIFVLGFTLEIIISYGASYDHIFQVLCLIGILSSWALVEGLRYSDRRHFWTLVSLLIMQVAIPIIRFGFFNFDSQDIDSVWVASSQHQNGWHYLFFLPYSLIFMGIQSSIVSLFTLNEKVRATVLSLENESLVDNLIKANITSATGALSAAIAHELNQPLSANSLHIQLLQMKLDKNELSPELASKVLASLKSDNRRAVDIVQSLRSIFLDTKINSQITDINELVKDILIIILPQLKKNKITLNVELCDFKDIPLNRSEIQQVILNIFNNAIQALASTEMTNKVITLRSVIHGDAFRLSIADNGAGVAEAHQDNLFKMFDSSSQIGMGFGLWLSMHIVTRHGGMLWYETALGGGANFVMELPLVSPEIE
jgi:signal transduction histidine kinase